MSIGARLKEQRRLPIPPVDPFPSPSMSFTLPYPLSSVLGPIQGIGSSVLAIYLAFNLALMLPLTLDILFHIICTSLLKSDSDWVAGVRAKTIPALNVIWPQDDQSILELETLS